jgi:hypothetical protein
LIPLSSPEPLAPAGSAEPRRVDPRALSRDFFKFLGCGLFRRFDPIL